MESGPVHLRQFRVRVRTQDGKWAEGDGPNKKQAAVEAARAYLEKHLPGRLPRPESVAPAAWRRPLPPHIIPLHHREGVLKLSATLGIPANKAWLVSQALTHPSFVNETRLGGCRDGRRLAQLGAVVLEVLSTEAILARFLGDDDRDPTSCSSSAGQVDRCLTHQHQVRCYGTW